MQAIKEQLLLQPKKVGDHPGDDPKPIALFRDETEYLGVPREYFMRKKNAHEVVIQTTSGASNWGGFPSFAGTLREEQEEGVNTLVSVLKGGALGGILRAVPGWGKTVASCALMYALQVPVLVVVHKEFLVKQWKTRIADFLPGAKIGTVQQDVCDFEGKSVVIAMVHSLVDREYPPEFYKWPGLVITDEVHRIGAETWSRVPPRFPARWRIGVSATPRRKDGADAVFLHHIGPVLFLAKERRLPVQVHRVFTKFRIPRMGSFNPKLAKKAVLLRFLCQSNSRNERIVAVLIKALQKGRKVIVLSERREHLRSLCELLASRWTSDAGPLPSTGFYVGGMTQTYLDEAAGARVIFATSQFASEGLDIPQLDTIFLATPLSDVEQAVGRIQRPHPDKKPPVVVDFRDDMVVQFARMAEYREKLYKRIST